MDERVVHPAVARVLRDHDVPDLIELLAERLSGADLTSVLIDVMSRRAEARRPADLLAQYERDRFVAPAAVDVERLLALEARAQAIFGPRFEALRLAPVVPSGAHSVLGGVSQRRVVATTRNSDVDADPTTGLALEAAARRRVDPAVVVRLLAIARVLRAQQFEGQRTFAHFSLLGLVTAGRDQGSQAFEIEALGGHLELFAEFLEPFGRLVVVLTDFGGRNRDTVERTRERLADLGVDHEEWPERELGRGYYPDVCFKLFLHDDTERIEVGDGGFVDWTARLLGNAKERILTSGIGLDRLCAVM